MDREWFREMLQEQHLPLRAFIHAIGARSESVDDLAQEVFVIAFEKQDEFDTSRDAGKWLRGIAFKLVVNERRKLARRHRIYSEKLTALLADHLQVHEDNLGEMFDLRRRLEVLKVCMRNLPEKSRELLSRRYEKDENASTLAKVLDMNPAAVRQSLTRIRKMLKVCIEARINENPA